MRLLCGQCLAYAINSSSTDEGFVFVGSSSVYIAAYDFVLDGAYRDGDAASSFAFEDGSNETCDFQGG